MRIRVRAPARIIIGFVVMMSLPAAVGCTASGSNSVDLHLRVIVPDGQIRREGVECAGARPFQFVHAQARFAVESQDGTVLTEGELPVGRAVNADPSIDWGAERIPTFCVTDLDLSGVPKHDRYRLRLEEGNTLEFGPGTGSENDPIALVVP